MKVWVLGFFEFGKMHGELAITISVTSAESTFVSYNSCLFE